MESSNIMNVYEKFKSCAMLLFLLYYIYSIKVDNYPGSHMTGSISNQFTNQINMLLHYDKHFITQIQGIIIWKP